MLTAFALLRRFWPFIAIALAVLFFSLFLGQCRDNRNREAQTKVDQAQAGAKIESGSDAVNTVANAGNREAGSEQLTRDNERDIRNAEGADQNVAAGVRDAGLASLCRRSAYANDPKCLQRANPK